ncbi:unnamed protein product [Lupinus luteus]|uniref:Uncharacterized protein n=1 Tax=Lupinus luteus TaxID=3873 RepID=A0AAV1WNG3_LUPLU
MCVHTCSFTQRSISIFWPFLLDEEGYLPIGPSPAINIQLSQFPSPAIHSDQDTQHQRTLRLVHVYV